MFTKISKTVRVLASVLLTAGSLALPLAAHAQYSGTNGQAYFIYTDTNGIESIAAMNSDGSQAHSIVTAPDDNTYFENVTVNPSGSKIAFVKDVYDPSAQQQTQSLVIANTDGSSQTVLHAASSDYGYITKPVFSSDGSTIYYAKSGTSAQVSNGIYSIPAAGGTPTAVLVNTSSAHYDNGNLAVTSSNLYFIRINSGGSTATADELVSSSLTGTNVTSVATLTGYADENVQDISPDGAKVLINGRDANNVPFIASVATTGGVATKIVIGQSSSVYIDAASYAPDGTKIMYTSFTDDNTAGTETSNGTITVNPDGTSPSAALRTDSSLAFWSSVANAATGTYTTPLAQGQSVSSLGAGGGDGTDGSASTDGSTDTASLPATGSPLTRNLPYLLLGLGLAGVGSIEVVSRVRRADR